MEETGPDSKTGNKSDSEPDNNNDSITEHLPDSLSESKPDNKPDSILDNNPDNKLDSMPDNKLDNKPDGSMLDKNPDNKPGSTPDNKIDSKPDKSVWSLGREKSHASYDSGRSSYTNRDPKYVFVDSNRDLLSEIGYAEDKLRLIPVFRQVEWDPTFWSLDDEIVQWFNNDDEAAVQNKIKELELSISEKEAMLVNVRKNMRLKNKERGAFRPSLDVFPSLVEPPNEDEPSSDLNELAVSICKLVKELKNAKLENLENELKLASMDEKISRIREVAKKSLEGRNKNYNVNAHLMAVETQNSMLHELLTVIVQKIKQTQQDVENLKSTDTKTLVVIIKENSELNFKIINACYPNMESKPGVGQWLWLPHDLKQMGFDDYLKTIKPKDRSLDITIDWKQLKKNVKEVEESCELLKSLKKKVRWKDHKKSCGLEGSIVYMTEEQIRAISWGPIREMQF